MTAAPTRLRFRRTCIAGQYRDDDYCVYDNGLRVGRILLYSSTPQGAQWAWHINVEEPIPGWCKGRAATLDEAKSAFRAAWQQFKPGITAGRMRHHREWQETEGGRYPSRSITR